MKRSTMAMLAGSPKLERTQGREASPAGKNDPRDGNRFGHLATSRYTMPKMTFTEQDRILGCLKGIATGDAVGKQTEMLSWEEVRRWYPHGIRGFEGPPGGTIPRYVGNSKREWRIGETTDDTERTIAVARAVIKDRAVSHTSVGREMLRCTKSVHPGVKSLWEFHESGNPARVAERHDGCGAATRVAPVGILFSPSRLNRIVIGAREASISTHGGSFAIAAAAATAAAVSTAIEGACSIEVLKIANDAGAQAEARWPAPTDRSFVRATQTIRDDLQGLHPLEPGLVAKHHFPDRPSTIVPLALGLATIMRSASAAIVLAANIGGDSDSVASIAGGILGALYPDTVNDEWYAIVEDVNGYSLSSIGQELAKLRN